MAEVSPLGVGADHPPRQEVRRADSRILDAVVRFRDDLTLVRRPVDGGLEVGFDRAAPGAAGVLPGIYPEWMGDRGFCEAHGCRFPYVVGEMARGLTSVAMVVAAVRGGLMAFYGSAGMAPPRIADAIRRIRDGVGPGARSWGMNLIHNFHDPAMEDRVVDLLLEEGVHCASASAFMQMTPALVRYACHGLTRGADGAPVRQNRLFAKISRPETAAQFMAPPPEAMLRDLVAAERLSAAEAEIALGLPLAEDITAEADSGGHTDNRPLTVLYPLIAALRDEVCQRHGFARPIRVGAAGGLGTPAAVAAAFGMGAAYVLTGSVNQSAVESGLSEAGRRMLAQVDMADVVMAPSADMFELGVKVQVVKRGTLFHARAARLYEIYRAYDGLDALPPDERRRLESEILKAPVDAVWEQTRDYFAARDPAEAAKAERDPKHRMALVFRWYLFHAVNWAMEGTEERRADYQIWCGPAMGAFNAWVAGSFLEPLAARSVVQIALNLLEGAATVARASQLRALGLAVPDSAFHFRPRRLRTDDSTTSRQVHDRR